MSLMPLRSRNVALLLLLLGAFSALLQGCARPATGGLDPNPQPLEITTPSSLPAAKIGTPYSTTLAASGGTTPYTWTVSVGAPPGGLTLSSAGQISGTPTTAGTFSFTAKATDAAAQTATVPLQITIAPAPLMITTTSPLTSGQVAAAYSTTLAASGGTTPYTWTVSVGALPGGLTLSSAGQISGTPTAAGTFSFTAKATDAAAQTATVPLQITIAPAPLMITTSTLPNGRVGVTYSTTLAAAGGTTPYTWSLTLGTLPMGLSLDASTGAIIGTPSQAATSTPLTFKATDSTSPTALTRSVNLTLTVFAVSNISVSLSPKRGGVAVGQQLLFTATVTNDIGAAGVSWTVNTGGTLTGQTTTTASFTAASAGVYIITATSSADITKSASATSAVTDLAGVLTYHNNLSRDGTNVKEYALTTALLTTTTFGKLFSCQADGAIYAQPLWVPRVTINGLPHNVIVVATQHDSVYAFDADAGPCITLWHANLLDSTHGGTGSETTVPSGSTGGFVGSGFGDITPEVGVTGTPVIDPATNTIYLVSKSVNAGTQFFQRLHALDLTTGNERVTPRSIDASISVAGTGDGSVNGQVAFDPRNENQRPSLVLSNGVVYISWASHEDHDPYHGWVMGFSASTLTPVANAVFNSTPNHVGTLSYSRGGIWMGGGAPAVDSGGNLFFITGNGTFDANTGGSNYGDSVVKLSTTTGLSVADYFTPLDQATLDANDTDFGSGAATILIDPSGGPVPHLVVGGGKQGNLFLLNRDNMGKFSSATNNVVQTINAGNSIFATPVFWQNNLYVAPIGALKQYLFNPATGKFNGAPSSQTSATFGFPGATPTLSSNGTAAGIVWAADNSLYCTTQSPGCGPAVLHAYDATNLATELWNSSQAAGNRDQAGHAVKFTVPTVANGKVYFGTRGNDSTVLGELEVYGLLPN
jgi:hypothetical protein